MLYRVLRHDTERKDAVPTFEVYFMKTHINNGTK
jgi:hypothetical protein